MILTSETVENKVRPTKERFASFVCCEEDTKINTSKEKECAVIGVWYFVAFVAGVVAEGKQIVISIVFVFAGLFRIQFFQVLLAYCQGFSANRTFDKRKKYFFSTLLSDTISLYFFIAQILCHETKFVHLAYPVLIFQFEKKKNSREFKSPNAQVWAIEKVPNGNENDSLVERTRITGNSLISTHKISCNFTLSPPNDR